VPSTIRGSDNFDSAPGAALKAWVNFNGANGAIRAQNNVSSVTRNGTGDYTVNFGSALADANYSVVAIAGQGTDNADMRCVTQQNRDLTSSTCRFRVNFANGANVADVAIVNVAIFR
jgi:hypothetical protein